MRNNLVRDLVAAIALPWIVLIASPIMMHFGKRKKYGEASPPVITIILTFLLAGMLRRLGIARICALITGFDRAVLAAGQSIAGNAAAWAARRQYDQSHLD